MGSSVARRLRPPGTQPGTAIEMGRSGAERYKATCHPRLGGACETIGLVRVAQAGVAGAALARDGKAGATARHAARSGVNSGGAGGAAAEPANCGGWWKKPLVYCNI